MKCIVFGGSGYLGSNLIAYLEANGNIVNQGLQFDPRLDLRDRSSIADIDWNVDCVFFMAGRTGTLDSFDRYQDFLMDNQLILLNVLDSIRKSSYRPKIVFPSTRTVYKGQDQALTVSSKLESRTLYAANKIACEQILYAYHAAYDVPFLILRICVPYGNNIGNKHSYGTLKFFLEQWNNNKKIALFGDGTAKRTLSHIDDVCKTFYGLAKSRHLVNSIFNVPGETYTLAGLALLITNSPEKIIFQEWPEMHLKIETGSTFFEHQNLDIKPMIQPNGRLKRWISEMRSKGVIDVEC
jgi:UDP-glucose 4-epimerase